MNDRWLEQFEDEVLLAKLPNGRMFFKRGTPLGVELTDEELLLLEGAALWHTHTTSIGGTFSTDDVWVTVETEAHIHIVEAVLFHEKYILERMSFATRNSSTSFLEDFESVESSAQMEAREKIWLEEYAKPELPIDDAGLRRADCMVKSFMHKWLKSNSAKYGFAYRFTKS